MLVLKSQFVLGAALGTLVLALTGCSQSQIYAADKASGTYVAIPNGFHKIEKSELDRVESKSTATGAGEKLARVIWQEAYTTSKLVTPAGVLSLEAPEGAIVYVRVRDLNLDEINSVSYDKLRNLILPLTTWLDNPLQANDKFVIYDDYERVEKVARGVRTIYTFGDPAGISETVDQTALVSDDRTRLYFLIIRAPSKYFDKHKKELQAIGDSFTVRGDK